MRYVFKVLFAAAARIQMQALPEFEVASKVDQAPHEWVGRNQGNQQKVSGQDESGLSGGDDETLGIGIRAQSALTSFQLVLRNLTFPRFSNFNQNEFKI
jgi:hypothetical protein